MQLSGPRNRGLHKLLANQLLAGATRHKVTQVETVVVVRLSSLPTCLASPAHPSSGVGNCGGALSNGVKAEASIGRPSR